MNTVKFPDTLKVIHDSAFEGCGLESVEILESVSIVCDYAFCSCNDLSEIKLHNGLVEIGKGVFEGCIVSELCIQKTVSK